MSITIPTEIIDKIIDNVIDMYRVEHQTKFKLVLINELHDHCIRGRIGQYKELMDNLPMGNVGFGHYITLLKEIVDLRFKHVE